MKNITYIKSILSVLLLVIGFGFQLNAQNDLYGMWARKINHTELNSGVIVNQVLNDSQGNTYISGRYYGTVSLSGNTCNLINSGGYPYSQSDYNGYTDANGLTHDGTLVKSDGFVSKYDKNGKWLWSATIKSNVWDQVNEMVLYKNEQNLGFMTSFGNINHSSLTAGTPSLTDGTGAVHGFMINTPPLPSLAYNNFVLLNTADGSKILDGEITYGTGHEYIRGFGISILNKQLYMSATRSSQSYANHNWEITTYNEFDGLMPSISLSLGDGTGKNSVISPSSKNNNQYLYYVIAYDERDNSGQDPPKKWYTKIAKLQSSVPQVISDLSYYYEANTTTFQQNYAKYGVIEPKLDVDKTDTHLFLTGHTLGSFVLQQTNQTITNSGGEDGIIICYDPQNMAGIRWMVNLRASGNQNITNSKFDETTQTLRVIGYIDNNEVDFNPKGTAMLRKATQGTAAFYAVYDMNGICQYVTIMDGTGDEKALAFDVFNNNISLTGTFSGTHFQTDPSGGLEPLRTGLPSSFLAKYSTNLSTSFVEKSGSYSAVNNIKSSYGSAYHETNTCLQMGTLNNAIDKPTALTYAPKNNATGTANVNYDGLVNVQPNVPAKGYTVTVTATNNKDTPAFMVAWIDFNGNGVFDPQEASGVIKVTPNSVNQSYQLVWTTLPNVTRAQLNTYLRIRLTSESLDETWVTGEAIDGEVEDYAVSLDLLNINKTAASNNLDPNSADVEDIITYTIEVTNKIGSNIVVFDPIPEGTTYVNSTPEGTLTTINLHGNTVNAVEWTLNNLSANITSSFQVQVKVADQFANGSILYNIAYAATNGDTISSTMDNCDMAAITIKRYELIELQNDYARVFACDEKLINIIANDTFPNGSSILISQQPKYGTAVMNSDEMLYTNALLTTNCCNFGGLVDSIEYQVCGVFSGCHTAYAIVNLLRCPTITLVDSCSAKPKLIVNYQYTNVTYDWEYSPDGTPASWTSVLSGNTTAELSLNTEGYYRVKIHYDGKIYQVKNGIKVTIYKKTTLPGDIIWYNMGHENIELTW